MQLLTTRERVVVWCLAQVHLQLNILQNELSRLRAQPGPRHTELKPADAPTRKLNRKLEAVQCIAAQQQVTQVNMA